MASELKLPRLGQGMESGTIVRWLKSEGDAVKKREPLYELDTDKVTQEVEAEEDGVLLKIVVPEGEVEVGTTIALFGTDGEAPAAETASEAPDEAVTEPATGAPEAVEAPEAAGAEAGGDSPAPAPAPSPRRLQLPPAPSQEPRRRARRGASRPPRSPAASRVSAASTSPPSSAQAPTGASSRTTSRRRPPERLPRRRRRPPRPPVRSRWCSSRRCARRSRAG